MRLATVTFQCLRGLAPAYLSEELREVASMSGRRHLRSAASGLLATPRVRYRTLGGRAFSACAARLWNKIPFNVKNADTVATFKKLFINFYEKPNVMGLEAI